MFCQVLGIVAGVLLSDHEVQQTEFQQLPYQRIFIMLFIELNAPDVLLENINFPVLTAFWWAEVSLLLLKRQRFTSAWLFYIIRVGLSLFELAHSTSSVGLCFKLIYKSYVTYLHIYMRETLRFIVWSFKERLSFKKVNSLLKADF